MEFSDLLYGRIQIPDWLVPFLRLPEFVRLRGVRLSNVDSLEFKDFSGPTRWEHGIAVAHLAVRCGERRGLSLKGLAELALAGLLHDVATPPFAHTAEYVLDSYDHELETERVLSAIPSEDSQPDTPVFESSLPRFRRQCALLSRHLRVTIDPDEVARMVTGDGELGFLVSGTLDLDNADNVVRGCAHLGIPIDSKIPVAIADWLAVQRQPPTDLASEENPAVRAWLEYRSAYYDKFFAASDQELGRQAFLQHLMRRALEAGLPRRVLIWSTDEGLLNTMAATEDSLSPARYPPLRELVERYRLLEPTTKIVQVDVESHDLLRELRLPHVAAWVERELSSADLEPFVMVSARRYAGATSDPSLFPPTCGTLLAFKLGGDPRHRQLAPWMRARIPSYLSGERLRRAIAELMRRSLVEWTKQRPWLATSTRRQENVVQNLQSVGDWSFRLSRNESLHAYPSTFVHAIPASLINCLGLKGELVVDPFGGTGQTAVEAIKYEGTAISADSNTIATLVAAARLTYLPGAARRWLATLTPEQILEVAPADPPEFELRGKWHHPRTTLELCKILTLIQSTPDPTCRQFLTACFSATIPATTGRRGKEHGFFADNTPLPSAVQHPPYQEAARLFLDRLTRNLTIIERLYAFLERKGRDPCVELKRARVLRTDARHAKPSDYGVEPHSVAGIITSPPYLCMSDYTLGQRLSYYWLAPKGLKSDFAIELGSRRQRSNPDKAIKEYFVGLGMFAQRAAELLRVGGFLATVTGQPVARAFKSARVLKRVDALLRETGFEMLWQQWRPIHWHRNQGYQRLRKERLAVYVAK